jgi:hypothetical protein
MDNLHPFLSGISGVVAATGVLLLFLMGRQRKMASIETELTTLRDGTVQHLCEKVEKHIDADISQEHSAKLDTIIRQNTSQTGTLSKLDRDSARQGATGDRNQESCRELWKSLDEHKANKDAH